MAQRRRTYSVRFAGSAARAFKKLSIGDQRRLRPRIDALASNPLPEGVIRLECKELLYRLKVGRLRIVYTIKQRKLVVLVVLVGDRKDVYKGLRRIGFKLN